MFIEKEDRLSQAAPPRRSGWDGGSRRRAPRNWQKTIRLALYGVIGVLAGLAALAGVGLFLDHSGNPPQHPVVAPVVENAVLPPAPPPETAPSPAPTVVATVPPPPDQASTQAVQALQQQIREANSALAGLRTEAEQLRQNLSDAARQRAEAAPAAPDAQPDTWADAERTIQALSQHPPAPVHAAPPPAAPRGVVAPAAPPATLPPATLAANALPEATVASPAAPRPRVVLHYQAGSAAGQQAATDIAQRLLFSDFVYADTRTAAHAPTASAIRYYFAEDQPAAERLAGLLGGTNIAFQVIDATEQPGHARHGTLDVWIGR